MYQDGLYQARAIGHSSDVVIKAEIKDNKIKKVNIDLGEESTPKTQEIINKLAGQIISKQNADLDVVTGATETSNATMRAVRTILNQAAGKKVQDSKVNDGTYNVNVSSYGWKSEMEG